MNTHTNIYIYIYIYIYIHKYIYINIYIGRERKSGGIHKNTYISFSALCWDISKFFEEGKIELNILQKRPDESSKVAILEDIDLDKDLETPNNNINKAPKQNYTPKKIELLKAGQIIKCKLANDTDSE